MKPGYYLANHLSTGVDEVVYYDGLNIFAMSADFNNVIVEDINDWEEYDGPIERGKECSPIDIEIAARVWCDKEMGQITMDPNAAMEIAAIIHRVRSGGLH